MLVLTALRTVASNVVLCSNHINRHFFHLQQTICSKFPVTEYYNQTPIRLSWPMRATSSQTRPTTPVLHRPYLSSPVVTPLQFHLPVSKEMFPFLPKTHLHQLQRLSGSISYKTIHINMQGTITAAIKYQLRMSVTSLLSFIWVHPNDFTAI